jgi:hypothetical protein
LDFINRPNPVEPHAVPEKHPLNDTQRLEKTSHQEFLRLLIDQNGGTNGERPAKRRKSGDAKLLDLPKLPAVRSGTKRLRIPPTLSGLHQPPPNAGLLPSISVDQPISLPARNLPPETKNAPELIPAQPDVAVQNKPNEDVSSNRKATPVKQKRNKWSNDETANLLKGVAKFGIGNWTQILNCPDYKFEGRSAIDLKDRFRVCCPNDYKTSRAPKKAQTSEGKEIPEDVEPTASKPTRPHRSDRKSSSELLQLGIKEPFQKSKRRRRTDYSAAEDEALLRGFRKHGNSWAAIRQDPTFKLSHRKATDLRDRFRTKYPEQYEKAGLAPKRDVASKKASVAMKEKSAIGDNNQSDTNPKANPAVMEAAEKITSDAARSEKENKIPEGSGPPKRQPLPSLLHYDPDVFWGAPFDADETEPERLTLDRRILDWPSDTVRPFIPENARSEIDSLATLSLHKYLVALPQTSTTTGKTPGATAALPSLADITAGSDDLAEHLELPSLMGTFGNFDGDARAGGLLPSLEELWK